MKSATCQKQKPSKSHSQPEWCHKQHPRMAEDASSKLTSRQGEEPSNREGKNEREGREERCLIGSS